MRSQSPAPDGDELVAARVANTSMPPDPSRYQKQLAAIMDIAWSVSSTLNVDALIPRVMQKVTEIIKADRSTFFVVDRTRNLLWSKVVQGGVPSEIRLGVGEGIAGWVAQTGQSVNLLDAYEDPRFNRSWDEESGYRTRSLLCVPVYDRSMSVVAAIQCLNKKARRGFDEEDEELLRCVSGQCAVALESAFLFEAALQQNRALQEAEARIRRANTELEMLYDLERQISEAHDPQTLVCEALERACALLKVEAGAIVLVNESSAQVFTAPANGRPVTQSALDLRQARALISRAQLPTYRVADHTGALADVLIDPASGIVARETFSAPLSDARSTIGMLQLANRVGEGGSEDWLLRMVSLLAGQVTRGVVVRREREAAERAQRLALLGHSLGAILHDMRTPMTAVSGYAELMALEDDSQVRADYVGRIGRAIDHMETMTQEALAFARGKREILVQKVYMQAFVESVREMLVPETQRAGVTLVIEAGYEGVARFDESKVKRVIFNLARNACQAMRAGGGTFTWRVKREEETLIFECADTGGGIPKEMEGKLFESFSTHGKVEGTGIGLAMAKKIVDAHCGTIECQSLRGHGATFTIRLPC